MYVLSIGIDQAHCTLYGTTCALIAVGVDRNLHNPHQHRDSKVCRGLMH